jgi:hypothetical protein
MVLKEIRLSEPVDLEEHVRKFPPSTRLFIAGPSGSGKSTFLFNIVSNPSHYFSQPPSRIIYYYKTRPHKDFEQMLLSGKVEFRDGDPGELIPELEKSYDTPHILVCIDDGLNYTDNSSKSPLASLFNRLSNHCCVSVFFCSQQIFGGTTNILRQIFLNCNAFALFESSNDANLMSLVSSRLFPGKSGFLPAALRQLKAESPFSPLIILTRPRIISDDLRVFSGLLRGKSSSFEQ